LLVLATLAIAGCGATPPQAPKPEADRLNTALSTVSSACAEAVELGGNGMPRSEAARLEHKALSAAPQLRDVYRRNPKWIYQGQTVAALVDLATSGLRHCGLSGAATWLRAAVVSHAR
jgi:hypothetical protein